MLARRIAFASLLLLALAGCGKTAEQKVAEISKKSHERQAVNFFSNVCVATIARPEKMEESLKKWIDGGMAFKVNQETMDKLKFKDDEAVNAWGVLNPVSGDKYAVAVTRKGACMVMISNLDNAKMKAEFDTYIADLAEKMKSKAERRTGAKYEPAGADTTVYHIKINNMAVGPQLSLAIPQKPGAPIILLLQRLVL